MLKRILITVPTLGAGGMERSALNFAVSLVKLGYEIKIFLISSNEIYYNVPPEIEITSGKSRTEDQWLIPYSLYKLRKFSETFQPDVILSFSGKMSAYVIMALKGKKISVLPFHRANPNITYGRINNFLNLMLFPTCKALIVQTKEAKEIFSRKYKNENIIVVPNPIRELLLNETVKKKKIIINTSRLVEGKGIEDLINIFHQLDSTDWSLHLLGDGYMRPSLESLVKKLRIQDKVKFLGFKKNVDEYLSSASIFAFTSKSEGFPNSLLEAMCSGLACISFDCPTGPKEMIQNGKNGFLIPLGNNDDYREKLHYIMNNQKVRRQISVEARKLNYIYNSTRIMRAFISSIENL